MNDENTTKDETGDDTQDVEFVEDREASLPDIKKKIADLKEKLAAADKERREYLEGWQRAKADHINYKKDEAKRLEDIARFASGSLIQDILPVLDSFDLALPHAMTHETEKGVLLIRSQLMDVLKKRGLEEIAVKSGDEFEPERHESIGAIESDLPVGVIAEEVQKGYTLHERVLRPSSVRLSKG